MAWNRTVLDNSTVYSCLTKLFEIELSICIKVDLALNNLQRLICHKTKPNKPNQPKMYKWVVYGRLKRFTHTHTHTLGQIDGSSVNHFPLRSAFGSEFPWYYNILDVHANLVVTSPSNCCLRVTRGHAS